MTRILRLGCTALLAAGLACGPRPSSAPAPAEQWVPTWAPSMQLVEPRNMPPAPLTGSTLRQVFRITISGSRVRMRLSNIFSNGPITVASARLARSAGMGVIDPASDRALTRVYGPRKLSVLSVRADIYTGKADTKTARDTIVQAIEYAKALPDGQRSDRRIASLEKRLAGMK